MIASSSEIVYATASLRAACAAALEQDLGYVADRRSLAPRCRRDSDLNIVEAGDFAALRAEKMGVLGLVALAVLSQLEPPDVIAQVEA